MSHYLLGRFQSVTTRDASVSIGGKVISRVFFTHYFDCSPRIAVTGRMLLHLHRDGRQPESSPPSLQWLSAGGDNKESFSQGGDMT